jgi:hypothetical protein
MEVRMFRWFPLLALPLALYNLLVLFGEIIFGHEMFGIMQAAMHIKMISGEEWVLSFGDILLVFSLLMLFIETLKSSGSDHRTMINHGLSMLVLVVALVEFIVLRGFGTSVFFFITVMALFDTVGGPLISIVASRRDWAMDPNVAADAESRHG